MERTDNIDEMSIEQLRDELLGAWGRLRNVKAILDDDYDRHKDDDKPMRENVAGDVLMHLHALKRMQASLSAERNSWISEALEWREHAPITRVEKADLLLDHETTPAPPLPTPAPYPPGYTRK